MKGKVARVTNMLLEESAGSTEVMSQLVANITNQRVVRPFLPVGDQSPQTRFGINVLQTFTKAKLHCRKAGSPADLLRRNLLVAGAEGPLSNMPVGSSRTHVSICICFLSFACCYADDIG